MTLMHRAASQWSQVTTLGQPTESQSEECDSRSHYHNVTLSHAEQVCQYASMSPQSLLPSQGVFQSNSCTKTRQQIFVIRVVFDLHISKTLFKLGRGYWQIFVEYYSLNICVYVHRE